MVRSEEQASWIGEAALRSPESLPDQIYKILRESILRQQLPGGTRLIEASIAKKLQASRTPVREALRRVQQDGLVERIPQGGYRVTQIAVEAAKDFYGIRAVLEAYAAELACDRMAEADLEKLRQTNAQARAVILDPELSQEDKIGRVFDLNTVLHETIYRASDSAHLISTLENTRHLTLRYRHLCLYDHPIRLEANGEHDEIVCLIEQRKKDAVGRLVRAHVLKGRDAALRALKEQGLEEGPV